MNTQHLLFLYEQYIETLRNDPREAGKILRQIANESGLSGTELAFALGVSDQTVQRLFKGSSKRQVGDFLNLLRNALVYREYPFRNLGEVGIISSDRAFAAWGESERLWIFLSDEHVQVLTMVTNLLAVPNEGRYLVNWT